jgi:hypothetical protein
MHTYETQLIIDAPPSEVWKHLIDVERHPEWSQHFRLKGTPIAGAPARIEFKLFGRETGVDVAYKTVDEPRELRWHGGPKGIAYGSHFCILEPIDGGSKTLFRHGESFSGVLARLVVGLLKSERDAGPSYKGFNEDLRRRVLSG